MVTMQTITMLSRQDPFLRCAKFLFTNSAKCKTVILVPMRLMDQNEAVRLKNRDEMMIRSEHCQCSGCKKNFQKLSFKFRLVIIRVYPQSTI